MRQQITQANHRLDHVAARTAPRAVSTAARLPSQLQLRRSLGNQAVQRLLHTGAIQAKLTIGAPNDKYEQEADRVAEQVMRMPEPGLQRVCACGGGCPKCPKEQGVHGKLQSKPVQGNDAVGISAPPLVHNVLRSATQGLDPTTRDFMESRFGRDLSKVRIHTGAQAAGAARSVGARAFTVGNDIVFGDGKYAPHHAEGRRLLAHELTHTVQQREHTAARSIVQRAITLTDPGDTIPHAPGAVGPFPTKAFTLDSWLDTLCPDGNWDVDDTTGVVDSPNRGTFCGARPTRGNIHHTTAAHPTSCGCLCDLTATGGNNVEIQIDDNLTVGGSAIPLGPAGAGPAATAHTSATDKITGITGRAHTFTGAGATTPTTGTGRTQTVPSPAWNILAHEICGHARLQAGLMGPTQVEHANTPEGNRSTMDVENRILREHSTVTASMGIRRGSFRARDAIGTLVSHEGAVYRVGSGETLSGIAVRCGIPVADMLDHIWRFNGDQITVATQNTVGNRERLLIEGIEWHEVIRGENMSTISTMWAVSLASLKRANPQVTGPKFIIRPGDRLLIPAS